jgi:hypothetical protein
MQFSKRIAACVAAVALLGLTAVSASAVQTASLDECRGRIGVTVQWSDSHVSIACTDTGDGATPIEILGVIVRWSDDSVSTVGLGAQPSSPSSSSRVSSSYSSSTTCINGQCTTTSSSVGCDNDGCWAD